MISPPMEHGSDIKIIYHEKNKGKGAAIRTAIKHVTGDIVVIQDADLEYDPNDYVALVKPIMDGTTTVVYGSRQLGLSNKHSYVSFYLGGRLLTILTNLLYRSHITDEPTCYKVFKSETLKSIPLNCARFEFCPEVTAKVLKRKIQIVELPIHYYPRKKEEGKKIKWKDGVHAIWTLLKYWIVEKDKLS
jgi:dolichol-phosphate mannosyltransferase